MTAVTTSPASLRYGTPADRDRVAALHDRCSAESRHRRFHSPLPSVPDRVVRLTLQPVDGWSVLAEVDGSLVGIACAGPVSTADLEVGILVEDAHQGRGIGTLLLLEMATEAVLRGYRSLLCLTQPDNGAVLGSVVKSGLSATTTSDDGLMCVTMHLAPDLALPASA